MTKVLSTGKSGITAEIAGLEALRDCLDETFAAAVDFILSAKNYLIVVGVDKSGHIGQKVAASFASTGTPKFFHAPDRSQSWRFGHDLQGLCCSRNFKFRRKP